MGCPIITIGADPELFVRDKQTGKFVSAHNLIPGTKENPHPVDLGAIQVDGVAAEFNILPTKDSSEFVNNISTVIDHLKKQVGDRYELVSDPCVTFDKLYFSSLPEDVRLLGCNPDYNAWSGTVNSPPDGSSTTMRTGAGHIHIGWCKDACPTDRTHIEDCIIVAKQLDYYLGIQSLKWDNDTQRRTLYGKAGCFRPKPYGMEYRSLSNKWLESKALQRWIWDATFRGLYHLFEGRDRPLDSFGEMAKEVIDNSISWWDDKAYQGLKAINNWTDLDNPPIPTPPLKKKVAKKTIPNFNYSVQLVDEF